eukprot:INCI3958.2.p1 GENE.INCI3958.2~~INCI3958.2.p1  ORF type:complete len:763 (+),score=150.86 INCI3958.2:69-2357(+)
MGRRVVTFATWPVRLVGVLCFLLLLVLQQQVSEVLASGQVQQHEPTEPGADTDTADPATTATAAATATGAGIDDGAPPLRRRKKKCYSSTSLKKQRRWEQRVVGLNVWLSGEDTLAKQCEQQCRNDHEGSDVGHEQEETEETTGLAACLEWCSFAFTQHLGKSTFDLLNDEAFPPSAPASLRILMLFRDPVERFISEFFYCTKTRFGQKQCLSNDQWLYSSHPSFEAIKALGSPADVQALEKMTLEEYTAIPMHPAANRYTRSLGGIPDQTLYARGGTAADTIDRRFQQFASVVGENVSLESLKTRMSASISDSARQADSCSSLADSCDLSAEANNTSPKEFEVGQIELQAALAAMECNLCIVGIVSSNRSVNDMSRDVLEHQLQWQIPQFPLAPDAQIVHAGTKAMYPPTTISVIAAVNEFDMQVFAKAQAIFENRMQKLRNRNPAQKSTLVAAQATAAGHKGTPVLGPREDYPASGVPASTGDAVVPPKLEMSQSAAKQTSYTSGRFSKYNNDEFKAESLEHLGYIIPEEAYSALLQQCTSFIASNSRYSQDVVLKSLIQAIDKLLHDVPSEQIVVIVQILAKRSERENGDVKLERLLAAGNLSWREALPVSGESRHRVDNNERERAPYKSPQPTTTQNPRTTGGATTRPAEREPEHVPIKERANVLAIDPEIPEGRVNWIEILALVCLCAAVPGFLMDEWASNSNKSDCGQPANVVKKKSNYASKSLTFCERGRKKRPSNFVTETETTLHVETVFSFSA